MIVAIDGPAGTGKSTIAKIIAEKLNITFLNSGGFYRAFTIAILDEGLDYKDEEKTLDFCKEQKLEYTKDVMDIMTKFGICSKNSLNCIN